MQRLMIEVDDRVAGWIERRRGIMRPEEFAARAIGEYMTMDERGTLVRVARMHEELTAQLDELQRRIGRLNEGLRERQEVPAGQQR